MSPPTVLHITECYAGGVESMLERYCVLTPEVRHVLLANARRADTAGEPNPEFFDEVVDLPAGHLQALVQVTKQVKRLQPDVIHAHSSFAGAYARLGAGWLPTMRRKIVYTPHCVVFNDPERPIFERLFFRLIEILLSPFTGVFAACSSAEDHSLRSINPFIARKVLRNAVCADELDGKTWDPVVPPIVGMVGRICSQRNPTLFAEIARHIQAIRPDVSMVWLGDGDTTMRASLEEAGVWVSGWMEHKDIIREISRFSVFLHCANNDGFPAAVLEAVGIGLPTVVPNIKSLYECPPGIRYNDRDQAVSAVITALNNPESVIASWDELRELYSESALRARLAKLYGISVNEFAA